MPLKKRKTKVLQRTKKPSIYNSAIDAIKYDITNFGVKLNPAQRKVYADLIRNSRNGTSNDKLTIAAMELIKQVDNLRRTRYSR